jgi:hypothetical protein
MDQEEQKVQEKLRKAGAKKKQVKDWWVKSFPKGAV